MQILTPDQRLRVFVSSTLGELSDERAAARRAIQSLRMAPVMFEMGARPHPPRNLYRAYLDQSHIFIGIFWQHYGWVSPEMDISGLEDEYLLAHDKPKLIYFKRPAPDIEPRLQDLLGRIREDDVSYRSFTTPEELEDLVKNDLAILLTERFHDGESEDLIEVAVGAPHISLPSQPSRFIGRAAELDEVETLVGRDDVRLATLIGPGGIGKTRLAVEAARRFEGRFRDGIRFVALDSIREPERLPAHLVEALGIKENTADPQTALEKWIADKEMLLVLDNFEQLLEATYIVARLMEHAPSTKILVTSRAILRIRGEHEYSVPPMTLPKDVEGRLSRSDAISLFVERAREVRPDLTVSGPTAPIVAEICRRLDGLPLAIELAAARLKVLSPQDLLRRLSNRLDLLTTGARDLPERQQTLRCTIDWSYQLLNDEEKVLFARLAVFRRGATLDAIEDVCASGDIDVIEAIASLIEKSLLRQQVAETGDARFWMLETIREFATDLLETSEEAEAVKDKHAAVFVRLCTLAEAGATGSEQQLWFNKVELDYSNIRVAADHLLNRGDGATVARMAWDLTMFTWVRGHMTDARKACEYVLQMPDIDDETRAYALAAGGAAIFWQGAIGEAVPMFAQAKGLFEEMGNPRGYALCLLVLGMIAPELEGPEAAKEKLTESIAIFESLGDEGWLALSLVAYCWIMMMLDVHEGMTETYERAVDVSRALGAELTYGMSLGNLGQHLRWQGRLDEAMSLESQALKPLLASDHQAAISYTFLNTAEILVALDRLEDAAKLVGASETILERLEVLDIPLMGTRRERTAAHLRARLGDESYEARYREGREMTIADGVRIISGHIAVTA